MLLLLLSDKMVRDFFVLGTTSVEEEGQGSSLGGAFVQFSS